jgi:putative flavoprotein involved in K+ transport
VPKVTTVVIGAGHCGLAVSRCLAELSIDHVVFERGEVANSWRTERWDSLRLLTPNWLTRLPGYAYSGDDPDGYMTSPEVVDLIDEYAKTVDAPVRTRTTVTSVRTDDSGFVVQTDQDSWQADAVVLASGACNLAKVPPVHEAVPAGIAQLTPMDYRNPDLLPDGGVLVVGASASGIQIADELHRSGRAVTLAVGEHVRMPRTYRGQDILWWMENSGLLDEGYLEMPDIVRARNLPSMQLVGSADRVSIDLNHLSGIGVELIGRLGAIRDGQALFSGSLRNVCALADLKLGRLLDTIDIWALAAGVDGEPPVRFPPTEVPDSPPLTLDLNDGSIRTILWATGYRQDTSWLEVPVLDRKGQVRHDGGVTRQPGLYIIGMPFLRRRKSSLIVGSEPDARDITGHLADFLRTRGTLGQ